MSIVDNQAEDFYEIALDDFEEYDPYYDDPTYGTEEDRW